MLSVADAVYTYPIVGFLVLSAVALFRLCIFGGVTIKTLKR